MNEKNKFYGFDSVLMTIEVDEDAERIITYRIVDPQAYGVIGPRPRRIAGGPTLVDSQANTTDFAQYEGHATGIGMGDPIWGRVGHQV